MPDTTLRHPRGLGVIFFTEMWERFSYYGMRALLVLYLVNALGYGREDALSLYATYTGLVYLTPVFGGWLADRWLGQRRAVLVGGLVMALGHFAMASPPLLHLALGLLVVGNGFFKPNLTTLVGALYGRNDPRRDGGFTIYYMGVNLGAFLAPLVAGTLGERLGWHVGFAAAGAGMLAGLAVFLWGQRRLGDAGLPPGRARPGGRRPDLNPGLNPDLSPGLNPDLDPARGANQPGPGRLTARDYALVGALGVAVPAAVAAALAVWPAVTGFLYGLGESGRLALGLGAGAFLLAAAWGWPAGGGAGDAARRPRLSPEERDRVLAILIMTAFVVFFWMGFEQAGGTMSLFADRLTDREVFGWEIPASHFQAINPLTILLLGPLFTVLWLRLDRSRHALPTPAKLGLGMLILGLGFVVLAVAQARAEALGPVSPAWLVTVFVLHTVGELFLSPINLSMVTKLAPARLVSSLMGVSFTAIAAASYLAGNLERLLADTGVPLYWFLVGSSAGAGLALIALTPVLKRLMHGAA